MNLVFEMEGVISHKNKPLANVVEFMHWLKKKGHHITIWSSEVNMLEHKMDTENWLKVEQVPYDRLLFDKPSNPVYVTDTPPNAKYFKTFGDNSIVATLFDEWVEDIKC